MPNIFEDPLVNYPPRGYGHLRQERQLLAGWIATEFGGNIKDPDNVNMSWSDAEDLARLYPESWQQYKEEHYVR